MMDEAISSPVEIRRLWPPDKEMFRDHLLRLDPRSRHLPFGGGMSDTFVVHYAENCFGKGNLVYGAFADGEMIGAAETRSNQPIWIEQAPFAPGIHAEAAFSVEESYRRRGIGEKLFRRILRAATNHGVETIEIVCLPENICAFCDWSTASPGADGKL
jgi:GNAT superfamily N-acetyltransferase